MAMQDPLPGADDRLDIARAAVVDARKREDKARDALGETRARQKRAGR